jgi:hypothetical protein
MITGLIGAGRILAGRKRSSAVRWCLITGVFVALVLGVATILLIELHVLVPSKSSI